MLRGTYQLKKKRHTASRNLYCNLASTSEMESQNNVRNEIRSRVKQKYWNETSERGYWTHQNENQNDRKNYAKKHSKTYIACTLWNSEKTFTSPIVLSSQRDYGYNKYVTLSLEGPTLILITKSLTRTLSCIDPPERSPSRPRRGFRNRNFRRIETFSLKKTALESVNRTLGADWRCIPQFACWAPIGSSRTQASTTSSCCTHAPEHCQSRTVQLRNLLLQRKVIIVWWKSECRRMQRGWKPWGNPLETRNLDRWREMNAVV